jgi:hypothetical protein
VFKVGIWYKIEAKIKNFVLFAGKLKFLKIKEPGLIFY